ncbi:hypothetical protein [Leptolyngbya sp. KIOST-1]|uniref:hypothetical protein n=1 Tax=Leptolyngbya sp. KIOST-1 TaxID=1229172 RepID=UPI000562E1F2|nr:hypothetical protein [Leptolyngbya sp. KIOST-1]
MKQWGKAHSFFKSTGSIGMLVELGKTINTLVLARFTLIELDQMVVQLDALVALAIFFMR